MKNYTLSPPVLPLAAADSRVAARIGRFVLDHFLLLPAGAIVALVWANTASESYFRMAHAIAFPVNEIGMSVFLALIAQEVLEAVMPGGELHTWRRWSVAVVAALGGFLGSSGVYLWFVHAKHELVLTQAWATAGAIDIAAGYYLLKLILNRDSAIKFLLLLAVVTDAVGLLIIATLPSAIDLGAGGILIAAAMTVLLTLRYQRVRAFWPYFVFAGPLWWGAFYFLGVHPALALVPVVPFLPRESRADVIFGEQPVDDPVRRAEHRWYEVAQVSLFLFGLVNAGVLLRGYGTGTWAILAAALAGRPLGILAGVALASVFGMRLPRHIGWGELVVIALATSSGFTFTLLFATSAVAMGPVLTEIKIGALLSVLCALAVLGAARVLRVGRFSQTTIL
jgi:Na+:H+ antiporter, NhaA family